MNIMVVLKNIIKKNDYIQAEYYPENSPKKGFMKIRIPDFTVIEHDNASSISASHVRRELIELSSQKIIPKQKTVLWY